MRVPFPFKGLSLLILSLSGKTFPRGDPFGKLFFFFFFFFFFFSLEIKIVKLPPPFLFRESVYCMPPQIRCLTNPSSLFEVSKIRRFFMGAPLLFRLLCFFGSCLGAFVPPPFYRSKEIESSLSGKQGRPAYVVSSSYWILFLLHFAYSLPSHSSLALL